MVKRICFGCFILVALLAIGFVTPSFAAETGSIFGKVIDKTGMPLPGVSVMATSTRLIGARNAMTDDEGRYRIPILPVGTYTISFEIVGYRTLKMEKIGVSLGMNTPVDVTLELAESIKEEIVVVANIVPLVDTKSANVSTYVDKTQLEMLPSLREFRDIMKFDPGITGVRTNTVDGNTSGGLPSIRGEGQYGNNYLIDGLSVRDPDTRGTGTPLNFDAIEEIQIITDGFNPEYGMALGGVVNVVTKSGGNTFGGEVAWIYESDVLSNEEKDALWATSREYTDHQPYINVGGPIVKDKLWFFTSFNRRDLTEAVGDKNVEDEEGNIIATIPSGGDAETEENNFFLKFSYQINPNHVIELSGTYFTSDLTNQGADELRTPEARWNFPTVQDRLRINYKAILTESTIIEFKAGMVNRDRDQEASSGDSGPAQYQNLDTGIISNNMDNSDSSIRRRQDVLLSATQYLEFYGSHELKAGIGYYWTDTAREIDWNGKGEDVFPNDTFDNGTWYQFKQNSANAAYYMEPSFYFEGRSLDVSNEADGINMYIQDIFSPMENLSIMLGFRSDTQVSKNDVGEKLFEFTPEDTFSPRMTVTWDITSDAKNIVKAGIGRFYDVTATSLAEWGNTQDAFAYRKFQWYGPMGEDWNNMTQEERNLALHDPNNWGDRNGNTGDPNSPHSEQSGESTPIDYDPDLGPYYKDEWLLEYNRKITDRYAAKARYVESHTRDLIEDVAIYDETGKPVFLVINWDEKRRDYKSYELEFNGRPTDDTMFFLSYVNSEAKGTNPGQFERGGYQSSWGSGNEVGVFGDHWEGKDNYIGLGGVAYGDEGWYGYLPYSVDHQIKFRGFWRAPYGFLIGTSIEWNSGYHWSKRGYVPAYEYSSFPEGRGSRTMPSIYYWDASVEKTFNFGDRYSFGAKLDIFNITNSDTAVSYVQEDTEIFGVVLKRQDPFSMRFMLRFAF